MTEEQLKAAFYAWLAEKLGAQASDAILAENWEHFRSRLSL